MVSLWLKLSSDLYLDVDVATLFLEQQALGLDVSKADVQRGMAELYGSKNLCHNRLGC